VPQGGLDNMANILLDEVNTVATKKINRGVVDWPKGD
jgi:hypothetical protein